MPQSRLFEPNVRANRSMEIALKLLQIIIQTSRYMQKESTRREEAVTMIDSFATVHSFKRSRFAGFLLCLLLISCVDFCFLNSCGMASASSSEIGDDSSAAVIHFIDVGQGDSIFIDTSSQDVLIDGGPADAGPTVLAYLESLNVTYIDLVVATHPHEDHIGGLVTVLNSTIGVDQVLTNNQTETSGVYTNFIKLAQNHTLILAQRGQTFLLAGTVNMTVFNPVQPLEFGAINDNSVVVKLNVGEISFLFMGDAEADAEQSMLDAGLNLKSSVLKVGHHGSRYATKQCFLEQVLPTYAIICAGKNNPYGHPHQETIQKLLQMEVTIYGTFRSGTIVAVTDGKSITFPDSPIPVPELQPSVILPIFITATVLAIILASKRIKESTKKTSSRFLNAKLQNHVAGAIVASSHVVRLRIL
jgi:competence protein ComEC